MNRLDPIQFALAEERKRQQLSMKALGARVGHLSYQGIWQWEHVSVPLLTNTRIWARALHLDIALVPYAPGADDS